jgi:Mg-chelatase subunit ChlD
VEYTEPHPVQVLAVFRLLSLHTKAGEGRKKFAMANGDSWLMQVKTGQGKSVLLGVLATALALTGHNVDCVCYSKYLSQRDHDNFRRLFQAFGVEGYIEYGTIDELAKKTLISQHGDVQHSTHDLFNGTLKRTKRQSAVKPRPKILLVDEVDVFLSARFYGNLYCPISKPELMTATQPIGEIQELIWKQTKLAASGVMQQVRSLPSYKQLVKGRKLLKTVFDGHISKMIHDAGIVHSSVTLGADGRFSSDKLQSWQAEGKLPRAGEPSETSEQAGLGAEPEPEPETEDVGCEKILYSDQDQESSSLYFGYETSFCYFKARDSGRKMDMAAAKGLRVPCGKFSYAEMTRTGADHPYACMLGVTGTLDSMGQFEQRVVREDFGVQHLENAPSMYGDSKLEFDKLRADHVAVETDLASHHLRICQEIEEKVAKGRGGVVLVFFDTEAKMTEFTESTYWSKIIERKDGVIPQCMTTAMSQQQIETQVRLAARPSTVTLLTREHGRGLDFLPGREVNENGGMHVVQTFFSKELAEEVQIKGRTARQERKGSYRMVLLASDLVAWPELGIPDAVERCREIRYAELDDKRRVCCEQDVQNRQEQVRKAKCQHDESLQFARQLRDARVDDACAYLVESSSYQRSGSAATSVRFVVDISGSMAVVDRKSSCSRISSCVQAMSFFNDEFVQGSDHVAITLFDNNIYANELRWTQKAGNEATIDAAISKCDRTGGTTYLWDAINCAVDNPPPDHAGPYWIVVLTDGDDSGSKQIKHPQLVQKVIDVTGSGRLGGLIAITAGKVKAKTAQSLTGLVKASGLDENGLIPAGDTAKIGEAFARAAEIMNDVVGRA